MKNKYFQIFLWIMTGAFLGVIGFLPETVPVHWNIDGKIDSYASRYMCIVLAVLPIVIYYGMILMKKIDPNQEKIKIRSATYEIVTKITAIFFIAFNVLYYYLILIGHIQIQTGICLIIGVFIIAIGNYLPKVPQNFFLGIRTPWTLKSEAVWKKTHKVGGYAFILLGIVTIISGFLHQFGFYLLISVCFIVVVFIGLYSYKEYRK